MTATLARFGLSTALFCWLALMGPALLARAGTIVLDSAAGTFTVDGFGATQINGVDVLLMLGTLTLLPRLWRRFPGRPGCSRVSFACACGLAVAASLVGAAPVRAGFLPGDVLLNKFSAHSIEQIDSTGTLQQTFTGTGQYWVGAALTPDGKLVTVYRNSGTITAGANILLPDGTQQTTFSFPNALPGDVVVFADGTIAVSATNYDRVDRYSPAGTSLGFINKSGGMDGPFGLALGPDDTLWTANRNSEDLTHVAEDGTDLGGFSLGFEPSDVVVDPTDATLWVSDLNSHELYHFSAAGASLGNFTTAVSGTFEGLGISSDGTLHVTGNGSTSILRYSSAGTLVGSLPINPAGGSPFRLTVVPVPEPATLVAAALGLLSLVALCARRATLAPTP